MDSLSVSKGLPLLICAALVAEACGAGWRRTNPQAGALKPRQQVQLWQGGKVTRWHAVVVTPDTVSGVPFFRPIDCDSCRASMPRSTVDSIRLGNPAAGFWKTVGLVIGVPFAVMLVVCIETGTWPYCFPTDGG